MNKLLPSLQIEIDIFSGRPNPKWILSKQQTKKFLEFPQWHEMMVTEENVLNFNSGFNGFIITKLSNIGDDLPQRFHLVNTYRPHYHLDNVLTKLSQKEMVAREEWLIKTCEIPQEYDDLLPYLLKFIKKKLYNKTLMKKRYSENKKMKQLLVPCL